MKPCTDERLMMRPRPRDRMCGRTSLTKRMTPKTLMSKTPWACSTEVSSAAPIEPMPALLTRTSIRPNRSITCWTTAVTDLSLTTSRSKNVTPRSGATREVSRPVPATSKPAATSASAVCLPMPEEAPVTRATGRFVVIMHSRTHLGNRLVSSWAHCKPISFRCASPRGELSPGRSNGRLRGELAGARRLGDTRRMSRQEGRESTIAAQRTRVRTRPVGVTQPDLLRRLPGEEASRRRLVAEHGRCPPGVREGRKEWGTRAGLSRHGRPQWRSVAHDRSRHTRNTRYNYRGTSSQQPSPHGAVTRSASVWTGRRQGQSLPRARPPINSVGSWRRFCRLHLGANTDSGSGRGETGYLADLHMYGRPAAAAGSVRRGPGPRRTLAGTRAVGDPPPFSSSHDATVPPWFAATQPNRLASLPEG